ncbi:8983_t:CDS:2, partial [Cetraspora pellucida]
QSYILKIRNGRIAIDNKPYCRSNGNINKVLVSSDCDVTIDFVFEKIDFFRSKVQRLNQTNKKKIREKDDSNADLQYGNQIIREINVFDQEMNVLEEEINVLEEEIKIALDMIKKVFNEYLTDDEFIHVIYVEELINETNNANKTKDNNLQMKEENSLLKTKLNKSSDFTSKEIERIRKENLLLKQENERVRNECLLLKQENE